ncbi:nuclease domain-containing protein [Luteibacter sp. NPDC031894]|uniref:nuclease domain-containing protein n=1 Tax=Luteibacter sp. NPDC031894 TaxID=3390572 RepID=UPI003D03028B
MKTTKGLQRHTPLRRQALGRVPKMAQPDGATEAVNVLAFPKRKKALRKSRPKMTPLRKSAKDEGCTIQKVGACLYDPKTVALAHLRWLGDCGGSLKPTDLQAVYACTGCNRWTDSPTPAETADRAAYEAERNFYCLRALVRTQLRMVAKGLITVKGMAA